MQNLNIPFIDKEEVYKEISDRKRANADTIALQKLEGYVFARYSEYEKNKSALEIIQEEERLSEEAKKLLLGCYTRKGYLEEVIEKSIKKIQSPIFKTRCPYCRVNRGNTMDHYLPKEVFPEFAILPINLIPCCGECNTSKGKAWKEGGKTKYINFYFDKMPNEQFLFAEISYNNTDIKNTTRIRYTVDTKNVGDKRMADILKSHFDELDLISVYEEEVEEKVSVLFTQILDTQYELKEFIDTTQEVLDNLEKNYGMNYWETGLYKAILESDYIADVYKLR